MARDHKGATKRKGGLSLGDVTRLFPTPKYNDGVMGRPRTKGRPIEKSTHLGTIVTLLPSSVSRQLPTPNTLDHLLAREGEAAERQLRRGQGPNASRRSSMGNLREDIITTVDPGRYGVLPRDLDTYTWSPFNTGGLGNIRRGHSAVGVIYWKHAPGSGATQPQRQPTTYRRFSCMAHGIT